jgi:hypothetical protein
MKQRIAYYSLVLLLLVVSFGLFKAKQQNKSPFSNTINNTEYKPRSNSLFDYTYRNNIVTAVNFKGQ